MIISSGWITMTVQIYVAYVEGLVLVHHVRLYSVYTVSCTTVHWPVHLLLATPPPQSQYGDHHQQHDHCHQAHKYQAGQSNLEL